MYRLVKSLSIPASIVGGAGLGIAVFLLGTPLTLLVLDLPVWHPAALLLIISSLVILFGVAIRSLTERALMDDLSARKDAIAKVLRDEVTQREQAIDDLARSERFLNMIFHSFHDPFCIINRDYRIVKHNEAYARMKDRPASDLANNSCFAVLRGRSAVCEDCIVEKTFLSGDPCAKEKNILFPDGTATWIEIYTYPIFDAQRTVTHVIEYARDITDRKKAEEEKKQLIRTLNHLSTTDGLTGLLNRRALNELLKHEIDRAVRYDANLSIILCDVDRFKKINDAFGHTVGDRALKIIAETLQRSLRRSDIVGRYGGDEFLIILPETSRSGAQSLAEKLRLAIEELDLRSPEGERIALSLSEGVASCCSPMEDIDTLVALVDTALYTAKESGRNKVSVLSR